MKYKFLIGMSLLILGLVGCSDSQQSDSKQNSNLIESTKSEILTGNTFTIVAKEVKHKLTNNVELTAWTFNGSVPGSQIRVKQGEQVKITFKNELPDPTSIHWHGIPVPNEMDGIPGVTQNAVEPGETFTYEFTALVPGTYMYHAHQDGVNQIDKGLYGSFVIEPSQKTYDRDYTLMLDEWMSEPVEMDEEMAGMDHGSMGGMDHSNTESDSKEEQSDTAKQDPAVHDMSMYDIYTINGKSGNSIKPLKVKEGERVRIRLINIGYTSHQIHLHGHDFVIAAIDGQELTNPELLKDQLVAIAPGERYDLEFTANNPGEWFLEDHGKDKAVSGMKTTIQYEGVSKSTDNSDQKAALPLFNFASYGKASTGEFTLDQKYDLNYTMDLNTAMKGNKAIYTINGKSFPNTEPIRVKEGDLVKVKLVNNSPTGDHPMHLHGHFFQVLSKNGQPISGTPIVKDTINVKPGEEYIVAFKADNKGNWLFHCHDLHHATAGMVNLVQYDGYTSNFEEDPNINNKPE